MGGLVKSSVDNGTRRWGSLPKSEGILGWLGQLPERSLYKKSWRCRFKKHTMRQITKKIGGEPELEALHCLDCHYQTAWSFVLIKMLES